MIHLSFRWLLPFNFIRKEEAHEIVVEPKHQTPKFVCTFIHINLKIH